MRDIVSFQMGFSQQNIVRFPVTKFKSGGLRIWQPSFALTVSVNYETKIFSPI